jgi:hypothetical protein
MYFNCREYDQFVSDLDGVEPARQQQTVLRCRMSSGNEYAQIFYTNVIKYYPWVNSANVEVTTNLIL